MNKIYEIKYNTNTLFDTRPDTELIKIIENSFELLNFKPDILQKINEDQDRLARKKKKLRIEDKNYYKNKNGKLPDFGNRNPVIGYKPQVIRSGNGFIPFIKVPEGNTSDAVELIPAVIATFERTEVRPGVVGTDDGYVSNGNRANLQEIGIAVVSMKGAKGKKITPVRSWNSKAYIEARNRQAAVESLIFSLKYLYEFGDVRRRGIEAVTAELLKKVIVYNFARVILIRKQNKLRMQQPA